jgi:hypothetical protein
MKEFKHKKGDFVRLKKYLNKDGTPCKASWEDLRDNYGLYFDTTYQVVGHTKHHPVIQSTDPSRPITFKIERPEIMVSQAIDWDDSTMELDEAYLKRKFEEIFG